MRSQRGAGLIEVIVAAAIIMLGVAMLSDLLLSQRLAGIRVDKLEVLKSVMVANSLEIEGTDYDTIPAAGQCLIRYYTSHGKFIREETSAASEAACQGDVPSDVMMKSVWRVEVVTNSDVTFSNSALGMPLYANPVKRIVLFGVLRRDNNTLQYLRLTQFKADGGE